MFGSDKKDESYALELDSNDPLQTFRNRFYITPNEIYMDGNSLGLLSHDAEDSLQRVLSEWKTLGINGWLEAKSPWFYYAEELSGQLAPIIGAEPEEIILHSSTTVNILAAIASFYTCSKSKNKILIEEHAFPTDQYAIQSLLAFNGLKFSEHLKYVKSNDNGFLKEDDIIAEMTDDVSLIFLPSVLYRSGQLLDIKRLTDEAHKRGILIGFDCAHSVGAIPHLLSEWDVDFACWCTYKYLNSGPGGVAGLYINKQHFGKKPVLTGWFGSSKEKQFDMPDDFISAFGAGAWQLGTPHILSLAPLEGSLKIVRRAGIQAIRKKSLALTDYLIFLVEEELTDFGFKIGTPKQDKRRGGHVALVHDKAVQINAALKGEGVVADFRFPNIIRIAPAALYTSFHNVFKVIRIIKKIMESNSYQTENKKRGVVA